MKCINILNPAESYKIRSSYGVVREVCAATAAIYDSIPHKPHIPMMVATESLEVMAFRSMKNGDERVG